MASVGGSSSGGSGSGGGRKLPLTRLEQWERHNPNSEKKQDLTTDQRTARRIEQLRKMGVPEDELSPVIRARRNQDNGGPIDVLVAHGDNIIRIWVHNRQVYYHLLIFSPKGSKQTEGDMKGIRDYIEEDLKRQLRLVNEDIMLAGGQPIYPPACYDVDLEDLKVPVPPKRRR